MNGNDTPSCTPELKKIKLKITLVRSATKIVVGLMALTGVGLGVWGQMKSGDTNAALKDTVSYAKKALPQVHEDVTELRADIKVLTEIVTKLREKVSYLEGQLSHQPRWIIGRPAVAEEKATDAKLEKVLARGKPKKLPTLDIQQFAQEE